MSSIVYESHKYALKLMAIYYGIPVFTLGVVGSCLNIIVFLSLKTFRQSSCAFYLLMMSIFDLGRLFTTTLRSILILGFGIDWSLSSLLYCRLHVACLIISILTSITCLCLAIIDQYLATCQHIRWHEYCQIKLAYRLVFILTFIWILHGIPYAIFYDHITSPTTREIICQITNENFIIYHAYGFFLTLNNLLPILSVIFGYMAFQNCRAIAYQRVPIFRRELDKQLTVMVLIQVSINFLTFLPYSIQSMCGLITLSEDKNVPFRANMALASRITLFFSMIGLIVS